MKVLGFNDLWTDEEADEAYKAAEASYKAYDGHSVEEAHTVMKLFAKVWFERGVAATIATLGKEGQA